MISDSQRVMGYMLGCMFGVVADADEERIVEEKEIGRLNEA